MRLFVAVRLDESIVGAAVAAARRLERRFGAEAAARWVGAENMHLTVRFIGHVPDDDVAQVLDALRPPLPIAPFEVRFDRYGVFPSSGPPRVVWIGLQAGLPSLRAMHEEFDRRLAPLGYAAETREFSAHLTLARFKDLPRDRARSIREIAGSAPPLDVRCEVGAASVFQSRLSPKGASYHPLLTIPCAG